MHHSLLICIVAATVAAQPDTLTVVLPEGTAVPRGGHLQGVQAWRSSADGGWRVALSRSSNTLGQVYIADFGEELAGRGRVTRIVDFSSDGREPPLRHAGGFQVVDEILAVGLEDNQDRLRSEVQFWDLRDPSRPRQLTHLTVRREGDRPGDMTAGAVGLLIRENDALLCVANWDAAALDFYRSNGQPPRDAACRFTHVGRWKESGTDRQAWRPDEIWRSYQSVNLLSGEPGKPQLLGFAGEAGNSVLDVFTIELSGGGLNLTKTATSPHRFAHQSFNWAGGAIVEEDNRAPRLMASEHDIKEATRVVILADETDAERNSEH